MIINYLYHLLLMYSVIRVDLNIPLLKNFNLLSYKYYVRHCAIKTQLLIKNR